MVESVRTLDTTLRDGEQAPGTSFLPPEKLNLTRRLSSVGNDVTEIGFAASSPADHRTIQTASFDLPDSIPGSLARTCRPDIWLAADALRLACRPRLHTFIASSDLHIKEKLRMNRRLVLARASKSVRFSLRFADDVEFSPEDGSRTGLSFLLRMFQDVTKAGANTLNITDTVGNCLPEIFGVLVKNVGSGVPSSDRAVLSVHCHNDLGLAAANTISGLRVGRARQVECTVNGIGERAGNAAWEEVAVSVKLWGSYFQLRIPFQSRLVLSLSYLTEGAAGLLLPAAKPVVGRNAFTHASGIHQDGVVKDRRTYEILRAEDLGWQQNRIVLGRLSGLNGFRTKLLELTLPLQSGATARLFTKFKMLTEKLRPTTDGGLLRFVETELLS